MNTELISKISVKTVYGKVAKPKEDDGVKAIVRVVGIATGIQRGESSYGEFTAFKGNFKAINLETGVEYRAGKAFLPTIAEQLIESALENTEAKSVEFAFDLGVKFASNPIGYEYTVTPLIEAQDNDPLANLAASLPALPAPAKAATEKPAKK